MHNVLKKVIRADLKGTRSLHEERAKRPLAFATGEAARVRHQH